MNRSTLEKKLDKFTGWLNARGAQVLAPTNEWEMIRFVTPSGVSVIYTNKRGEITATGQAKEALDYFLSAKSWSAGVSTKRKKLSPVVNTLLQRDGDVCFLCKSPLQADITIDHLVPVAHGGPNHISNLVLMHNRCNQRCGHMDAITKIRMREAK